MFQFIIFFTPVVKTSSRHVHNLFHCSNCCFIFQFIIFFALVAMAAAAPAPAPAPAPFVFGTIPFSGVHTYSAPGISPFMYPQTVMSSSNIIPTVYSGVGTQHITYTGAVAPHPITYTSAVAPQHITYSAVVAPQPIVYSQPIVQVAGIVPKSVAQTPGSSHIVY